jgi:hypothetical protein
MGDRAGMIAELVRSGFDDTDTLDQLRHFLADCSRRADRAKYVMRARRAAEVMLGQMNELFPTVKPVDAARWGTAVTAGVMLLADQLVRPRDSDVPLSLDPFYIRLRWRKRDRAFAALHHTAWVAVGAYRTNNAETRSRALLAFGRTIEELVFGATDEEHNPELATALGRSALVAARCFVLDASVFYASDVIDVTPEVVALIDALNRDVIENRARG